MMNNSVMIYPVIAQLLLIFIVLGITGRRRLVAAKSGQLPLAKTKTMQLDGVDEALIVCGRNFDNQFQLPMLFLMMVLFCLQFSAVDWFMLSLSWLFVITRYCHSYIHLGSNIVKWRFSMFGLGALFLMAGWIRLLPAIL